MGLKFNVPTAPRDYRTSLTDFLGIDKNNPLDMDVRHSPKLINYMKSENGRLKKRYGLKIKTNVSSAPIYGIYQYDVPDVEVNEIFLIHCGTELYEVSTDFTVVVQVMTGLAANSSYGMFLGDKLVILDGKRAIIYGKFGSSYEPRYIDSVAYTPTRTIGLKPNGTGGTSLEDTNLMSQYNINEYVADGTSVVYKTDAATISAVAGDTSVWIVSNITGLWTEVPTTDYTVSTTAITFTVAPEAPVVVNSDNVRIKFKDTTSDNSGLINKCRFCTPFGYQGNNQRLFYSGNPEIPNVDWHSDLVESQPDPTYISDTSMAVIGSQPITGYHRLSDGTLAILKNLSDTDCSIYYRTSNAQGRWDVFPLLSGTKNVGCLTNDSCQNVNNYSLFLSDDGVYQFVTGSASSTLERYADNKSYFINPDLIKEANLQNAKSVSIGSMYYLFINGNCYVANTAKLTENKNVDTRQYQWYFLRDMPCSAVMKWNNQLIIGDSLGNLKMVGDDYIDELTTTTTQNVYSYFETMPLDFGNPLEAKTTRDFILNYIADENTKFDFGYKTIDEEKVISTEIFKIVSGTLPTNPDKYVELPYGTKLNFNTTKTPVTVTDSGFLGFYYGTQTATTKTIFGFYKPSGGTLSCGIYVIKNFGTPGQTIEAAKVLFDNNIYINSSITLKKLLSGSVNVVATDLGLTKLVITGFDFGDISISDPTLNGIPQTIEIKEKARKIMFIKFFIESEELASEFDRIYIKYRNAGKYRGE